MIGEVIQHILDKKFFVSFSYDGVTGYRFRAWKFYRDDRCQCEWAIDSVMVDQVATEHLLVMETDRHLKQVDHAIARRRLIEEALEES